MTSWLRFEAEGEERFGTLAGETITECEGDMFGAHRETGRRFQRAAVRLLTPTRPGKMIGLWNNFHERARVENLALHVADESFGGGLRHNRHQVSQQRISGQFIFLVSA